MTLLSAHGRARTRGEPFEMGVHAADGLVRDSPAQPCFLALAPSQARRPPLDKVAPTTEDDRRPIGKEAVLDAELS